MGVALSRSTNEERSTVTMEDNEEVEEFHDTIEEMDEARAKAKADEMEVFRKQLEIKREQRKEILARHRSEKLELEASLESERKAKLKLYETNRLLREILNGNNIEIPENLKQDEDTTLADTVLKMNEECERLKDNNNKLRRHLAESNVALQGAYTDIAELSAQNTESIKHINALKEVISVSKTMISLREDQLNELKAKLNEIERSLADRETSMLSSDLRQEYERQLQNIRTLRALYEERARLGEVTRQGLVRDLEEQKVLKQTAIDRCTELTEKVRSLEATVEELHEIIETKDNQISLCNGETNGLKAEMTVVNKLFSQVLLGYKTKQDLDKLVHRLEENHGLLTHMAERENGSEASSELPKLLLELVSQVDEGEEGKEKLEGGTESAEGNKSKEEPDPPAPVNTSAEEIVENLPKVWRVLIELLSHQSTNEDNTEKVTTCYKSVETSSGPVLVPSVSQTYIRLKDLIIEKLALIKEVNRMKQLNAHLETRLGEQEKKLSSVTTELSKTWHVVGRLRRHHHQLHTHEKILKYELQQKRKLLNELKEELEYCREKWEQAREKNTQSEKDWRKLRAEFTSRKTKPNSFNNSAESGYSDERPSDESSESNDDSYINEPLVRSKKKTKKSFETILDSSTDLNLAAEREDPASDMLDVADLPLDTQEGEHHDNIDDSCTSESQLKSEKVCETEDEIGEITHDSCIDDFGEHSQGSDNSCTDTKSDTSENSSNDKSKTEQASIVNTDTTPRVPEINPAAILESIRKQNERLAARDKKLEKLEKSGAALLMQTRTTAKISEQINNTLDHLINRPTSSYLPSDDLDTNFEQEDNTIESTGSDIENRLEADIVNGDQENEDENNKETVPLAVTSTDTIKIIDTVTSLVSSENDETVDKQSEMLRQKLEDGVENETLSTAIETNEQCTCSTMKNSSVMTTVDPKSILDNIKQQNERLVKKDERLQKLENGCSQVLDSFKNTLRVSEEIVEKLDSLKDINSPDECGEIGLEDDNCAREDSEDTKNEKQAIKDDDVASNYNIEEASETASVLNTDISEPSTSSEMDHEARFAARDIRLKRLEEQTKSLVNKVNKTTSKGVKINYKLEELHNIYGSENSRAGTPADEDKSQNDDDVTSMSHDGDDVKLQSDDDIKSQDLGSGTK